MKTKQTQMPKQPKSYSQHHLIRIKLQHHKKKGFFFFSFFKTNKNPGAKLAQIA